MNQNFEKCMEMLLVHEGGYVNHPSDPGGMTNLGVTKKTYDHHHGTDIDEEGMRNLTVEDVMPIYKTNYWERCRCQDLPSGVDWAVFDWAVNSGPGRAIKALQRAVGTFEDGAYLSAHNDVCEGRRASSNHQQNGCPQRQFLPVVIDFRQVRARVDTKE